MATPTITPITLSRPILDMRKVITALTGAVADVQAEGVRLMATYPPAAPGQKYVRTGTLKRSWSSPPPVVTGNAITGEIGSNGNIAPYNQKVEGSAQDAFFAARGWPAVPALVALVQKQLPLRGQAALNKIP